MKNYVPKTSGYQVYSLVLAKLADFSIVILMGLSWFWIYFPYSIRFYERYQWMIAIASVVLVIILSNIGAYVSWRGKMRAGLIIRLVKGYFYVACLIVGYLFFLKQGERFSRVWVLLWLSSSFLLSVIVRILAYKVLSILRKKGMNGKKVVLIGDAETCAEVLQSVREDMSAGYFVTEIRCQHPAEFPQALVQECKLLPLDSEDDFHAHEVWICLPLEKSAVFNQIMDLLRLVSIEIRYIPDMKTFHLMNYQISYVAGHYALDLNISPMHGYKEILKWIEDKVLASIGLIVASPIMLGTAIGVFIKLGRPIFFKQERVSWNGKPFTMYKFRSMPVCTENECVWGKAEQKVNSKFGRFLRKSNFDELPQLWNVLKGNMSMVGPRPEQVSFVEEFKHEIPGYMQKHMVKGGITGWAQVNGLRGDTDLKKRIEHDIWYIENWSLWLDVKILVATVTKMIN